jgi:threonine dehydratase
MPGPLPTLQDLFLARWRIAAIARRTPLVDSPWLADVLGRPVRLKLENLQETGSFKLRGAANRMLSLAPAERARGVIAVSTGNHGRAVAYVARELGIRALVCVSEGAAGNKVDAMRQLGAEVVVHGRGYDQAEEHAAHLRQELGLTMIEPFDDPLVIAGQGTIGLELLEDWPELDTAVVPLSGGGLISGIALALKSANPAIRVIGVSMERAPVMYHSLRAGRPIRLEEEPTLADALAGGIGLDNRYSFRMVQELVDDVVLVSEVEIATAMAGVLQQHHLVVEGGGAVGLAAVLQRRLGAVGARVAIVVSGGNVDAAVLQQVLGHARRTS